MTADRAAGLLQTRVARLDESPPPTAADPRLVWFTDVMSSYTNTTFADGPPVLDPATADDIVGRCRLLTEIAKDEPTLIAGPIDRTRQHWISTSGEPAASVPRPTLLRESGPASSLGLFTSTATTTGHGMWQAYLDLVDDHTSHPLPWHTWRLRPDDSANVLEITSAQTWATFLTHYPRLADGSVRPDWPTIARDFAGIHLALPAIAAIQGFRFPLPQGISAPTYWDVESTLWLRWCFTTIDHCATRQR